MALYKKVSIMCRRAARYFSITLAFASGEATQAGQEIKTGNTARVGQEGKKPQGDGRFGCEPNEPCFPALRTGTPGSDLVPAILNRGPLLVALDPSQNTANHSPVMRAERIPMVPRYASRSMNGRRGEPRSIYGTVRPANVKLL